MEKVRKIFEEINNANSDLEPFGNESDIVIGLVLAAVFPSESDGVEYFRAKVIYIEKDKETGQTTYEVRNENHIQPLEL